MSLAQNGQEIYAVALERFIPARRGKPAHWQPEMHHIHADSAAHAQIHFKTIEPDRRKVKIIGAALAIGYQVADKHGDVLYMPG